MAITKKKINKIIGATSKGFFSDESWTGVHNVWNAIRNMGVDLDVTSADYQHDSQGRPVRKVWGFTVTVDQKSYVGRLVASGAGSVEDPLSRYDITAYVS